MSTKISAVVKAVLQDDGNTAIVLVLEKPFTASFEKEERVYVELTRTVNGDKVEFYPAPPAQAKAEPEEEEEEEIDSTGPVTVTVEKTEGSEDGNVTVEPVTEPVIDASPATPAPQPEPEQPSGV